MPSFEPDPILATVTRSGRVESWHRGAVAVVHEGDVLLALGDVAREVFCRSAVKPFQALPLLERGLHRRYGLEAGEIALLAASHDGSDAHVAGVRAILGRAGLAEDLLGCGAHAPFDQAARQAMARAGERAGKVHNNCSGKHTGFLLLARELGQDLATYLDPEGPAQQEVHAAVAAMAGVPMPVPRGIDGCAAPTFVLPLLALATAFARLANPDGLGSVRRAACTTLLRAAGAAPVLLSGRERLCAHLLAALPCAAFPKNGAEGVYAVALAPDPARRRCPGGVGIAIKVADGAERGYQPVVVDLLRHLGAFAGDVPAALADWHRLPVRNTRKERVGEVACAVDWATPGARS